MRKAFQIVLGVGILLLTVAGLFLLYLTIREYRPEQEEPADLSLQEGGKPVPTGSTLTVLSWNVGFCAFGGQSDFVMDGGGAVPPADETLVRTYMAGVKKTLTEENADFYLLQEVDSDSRRTFYIDQREELRRGTYAFAPNYRCDFVPFPWPPWGKVESGVMTTTGFSVDCAKRIALPCPFSWPLRTANLKRCLLVSYVPVEGSTKKLVLVNLHLEAYDDGEAKKEQTRQLMTLISDELDKGNYVIAGGDWNQAFPGTTETYPNTHEEIWVVPDVETESIPHGCSLVYDETTPSCRLMNQPYHPEDVVNTQYYIIDGFLVSGNIQVESVRTLQKDFENSDHNPVRLEMVLLPENS